MRSFPVRAVRGALVFAAIVGAILVGCSSNSPTIVYVYPDASTAIDAAHPDATTGGCSAATRLCDGACVKLSNDPNNCGACAKACSENEVCSSGTCGVACGGGTTKCDALCVDTQTDPANCGGCGTACDVGEVCSGGTCGSTCAMGQTVCGADAGTPYCANTQADNANCGACGNVCGAGLICSGGHCGSTCAANQMACGLDGGAPYCANIMTDNSNCGGCGTTCTAGQICARGVCGTSCVTGENLCGAATDGGASYCANFVTDNANCGGCGITCPSGLLCSGSVCTNTCIPAEKLCPAILPSAPDAGVSADAGDAGNAADAAKEAGVDGGITNAPYCANLQTDNNNCGGCGVTCGAGQACANGSCTANCGTGSTYCSLDGGVPYCAKLTSDNNNCGSCGNVCKTGPCSAGVCSPAYVYSQNFLSSATPTAQCTAWTSYVGALGTTYLSMNMRGSLDDVGITCSDPTVVNAMATALRTGGVYTGTCNGHTWSNCNRYGDELWIDPPSQCSGANCPSPGYLMRPCFGATNWGGVNSATCGGPSQTMTLVFQ